MCQAIFITSTDLNFTADAVKYTLTISCSCLRGRHIRRLFIGRRLDRPGGVLNADGSVCGLKSASRLADNRRQEHRRDRYFVPQNEERHALPCCLLRLSMVNIFHNRRSYPTTTPNVTLSPFSSRDIIGRVTAQLVL